MLTAPDSSSVDTSLLPKDPLRTEPAGDAISTEEFLSNSDVFLTEVLDPKYPRSKGELFTAAKQKEIYGLKNPGTWSVISKSHLPDKPNVLGGRFVLALNNVGK